jgi:hypothetical protein
MQLHDLKAPQTRVYRSTARRKPTDPVISNVLHRDLTPYGLLSPK